MGTNHTNTQLNWAVVCWTRQVQWYHLAACWNPKKEEKKMKTKKKQRRVLRPTWNDTRNGNTFTRCPDNGTSVEVYLLIQLQPWLRYKCFPLLWLIIINVQHDAASHHHSIKRQLWAANQVSYLNLFAFFVGLTMSDSKRPIQKRVDGKNENITNSFFILLSFMTETAQIITRPGLCIWPCSLASELSWNS